MPSNLTFIIAAYGVTWAVILGYMVRLARKGARASAEFDSRTREAGGEQSR